MITLLRKLWQTLLLTTAVLLILLATLFGLARVLLPFAADYRAELEQYISDTLKSPVRIGQMDVEWHGWGPRMRLQDIALTDDSGKADLFRLQELFIDLQLGRALYAESLQIADIHLEGVRIILQRNVDGSLALRGLRGGGDDSSQATENTANIMGFMLLARRVDLLNATIMLSDVGRGIEYVFPHADIYAQNDGDRHRFYAQVELPSALGKRIDVHLDFNGSGANARDFHGTSYIRGEALQLVEFLQNLPAAPVVLQSGVADFALWGEWRDGKLQSAITDAEVRDVALLGRALAGDSNSVPWVLERASLRSHWQRVEQGWDLAVNDIQIRRNDTDWARNDVRIVARKAADGQHTILGNGRFLPVHDSVELLMGLVGDPELAPAFDRLATMQPHGTLQDWQFEIDLAQADFSGIRMAAKVDGITTQRSGEIPGVDGLSGVVHGVGDQIQLTLDAHSVTVDARPLMRGPIYLDNLIGDIRMKFSADEIIVDAPHLRVENSDLKSSVRVNMAHRANTPLFIDMQANFEDGHGAAGIHYLPVGIMDEELIEWLDNANLSGRISRGSLLLRGNLDDFPFYDSEGAFELEADIRNASLDYFFGWPPASSVDGLLRFFGPSLTANISRGEIHASGLEAVVAHFDDLDAPVLKVSGVVQSFVPELLHFARLGPLADDLGPPLRGINGSGPASVDLRIEMPLADDGGDPRVDGGVTFDGARFFHRDNGLEVDEVHGAVQFDTAGIRAGELSLRAFDETLQARIVRDETNTNSDHTAVMVSGNVTLGQLLADLGVPLDYYFRGRSLLRASFEIPHDIDDATRGGIKLKIASELLGTQVELPAPLGKTAEEKIPIAVDGNLAESGDLISWSIRYGDRLAASVTTLGEQLEPRIQLRFGGDDALPKPRFADPFVRIDGQVEAAALEEWRVVVEDLVAAFTPATTNQARRDIEADLRFGKFTIENTHLDSVQLNLTTLDSHWRIDADSEAIAGEMSIARPYDKSQPIELRLRHFNYDALSTTTEGEQATFDTSLAPDDLPPLTILIDQLMLWGFTLHGITIVGAPQPEHYSFDRISVGGDHYSIQGSASWKIDVETQQHTSELVLGYKSGDLGRSFAEMGNDGIVAEGRGSLTTELRWPAAIFDVDTADVKGAVEFKFRDGRVLAIDPGAGRLVGLLAFQELPRRLQFDFKDALRGGMEYEKISGQFVVDNGKATTELVRLEGPIGIVDIVGNVDFDAQTYDQEVVVLPRLTSSIPWIGVISSGLAGGLTILLADEFLKNLGIDLDAIGRRRYTLTGSWDNPVLTEILPPPDETSLEDR